MSQIISFPITNTHKDHDYDSDIDDELASIPAKEREKLRFELIKTIDSYDNCFSEWTLDLPDDCEEALKKQIYDIAHEEHARKTRMLKDIMILKARELVAQYHQRR